jgi:tripartite-type tricarboxylate transporter receptor subunit TctC
MNHTTLSFFSAGERGAVAPGQDWIASAAHALFSSLPGILIMSKGRSSMRIHLAVLAAALSLGMADAASAQAAYPQRTIKIVVGFPPGVPGDVMARIIAAKLAEGFGQPVIVENRPGAGSSTAADAVAKAEPDGYTLFVSSIANSVNQNVSTLPFHLAKDLAPVSLIADVPGLLVAHPSVPGTVPSLIAAAKAKPDAFSYGSSGPGTSSHLYGELFNLATGTKLLHIPYKGSSQTLTDLLSGQIQLMFTPASTVIPNVQAGQIKAMAAIGQKRLAALPEVATFTELGIAGYEAAFWFGLNAPAATPKEIIERLNKEIVRVLALPDVREKLMAQSIEPVSSTSAGFGDFLRQDLEKWARVVKAAGVKAQ